MRYFTADLHLGHLKVAKIRFPESAEHLSDDNLLSLHDGVILRQIQHLTKRDDLYILGDISSGSAAQERSALSRLARLKNSYGFNLHLISGNHDSVSSIHKRGRRKQREFLETFDSVQQFAPIDIAGQTLLMSHFPYANLGDGAGRDGARYLEFRLPDMGYPLIHGHTHQRTYWNGIDPKQYCVSWDASRDLVPENRIEKWVDETSILWEWAGANA